MTTKEDFRRLKEQMSTQIFQLNQQKENIERQIAYCESAFRVLELEEKLFCKEEKPREY